MLKLLRARLNENKKNIEFAHTIFNMRVLPSCNNAR